MLHYSRTAAIVMAWSLVACAYGDAPFADAHDPVAKDTGDTVTRYEAERHSASADCSLRSNHVGFTGAGFMDYGGRGSWVEWRDIQAPSAGRYLLEFRYANSGGRPRVSSVHVNSELVGSLPFERSGRNWASWSIAPITVRLAEGRNTLRVRATSSAGGPNLDHVVVTALDTPPVDHCPMDPAKTEPGACGCGLADEDANGDGIADCEQPCPPGTNDCDCVEPDGCAEPGAAVRYEAEQRSAESGCAARSNHDGFTGDGFMDFGGVDSWIEWDAIHATTAGRHTLQFRYANASGAARPAEVEVNGRSVAKVQFARSGSRWWNWAESVVTVELEAGHNTVRVRASTGRGGPNLDHMQVTSEVDPPDPQQARGLYTYDFGGLENLSVEQSVNLLREHGYAGIAVEVHRADATQRLAEYLRLSEEHGDSFQVVSGFVSHKFHRHGWSDAIQRAVVDTLAGRQGQLWIWFHDPRGMADDPDRVQALVRGIVEYAAARGVQTVLYPHHGTLHPTTLQALRLVEAIDHDSLSVAVNLTHEILSDREQLLSESFERARPYLGAVTLAGAAQDSAVMALHESETSLSPFVRLVAQSGFEGPVGFLNHKLPNPDGYLPRSMAHWKMLCEEAGLHE